MCKTSNNNTIKLSTNNSSSSSSPSSSSSSDSLQLLSIKNSLPSDVFIKSLITSLFYLFIDLLMWGGSLYIALIITKSEYWKTLEFYQQALFSFLYWNFSGFFMWSLFVVGHDCGHGTFSDYEWVNDLVGNLVHGSLLVPYWPWQMTHRRHHMYHNHAEKDYSHPWYTPERLALPECGSARFVHKYNFIMSVFPYIGWPLYLLGAPDGNHFIPIPSDRMWKEASITEYIQCIVSSIVVITWATFVFFLCDWNLSSFVYYYFIPILVFGWWLVTVTYLQHHSPSTLIYDDKHWKFLNAAFETVDRKYGFGIDFWSHHITDCHVVHHLFFTKIPHYNLYRATEAMKEYLKENNLLHYYRCEDTKDFFYRIHYYLVSNGLRAILFDPTKHSNTKSSSPASVSSLITSKDEPTIKEEENKKKI